MVTLYNPRGEPVVLGAELARGGEGAVFELASDASRVAKRYLQPPAPAKVEKLRWMVAHPPPGIERFAAWPTDVLHAQPGGPVAGFLMPRVEGCLPIHTLYNTASRRKELPHAGWSFLLHAALNCAIAFERLHAAGHLAGDINESNLLVSARDATVRFIDCDSFHVHADGRRFPCEVGVPFFTPPELQGQGLRGVARTRNHDCFGLAVLLFQLLFVGRHPFTGLYSGAGEMPPERAIREFRFAYGRGAGARQMAPPPGAVPFETLPPELAHLFEVAFSPASAAAGRPTAAQWHQALLALLPKVRRCAREASHQYPGHLPACVWCQLLVSPGVAFFVSVPALGGPLVFACSPGDLDALSAEVYRLANPTFPPVAPPPPAPLPRLPEALVAELAQLRRLGAVLGAAAAASCVAWLVLLFASWAAGAGLLAAGLAVLGRTARAWSAARRALLGTRFTREREALAAAQAEVASARLEYTRFLDGFQRQAQVVRRRVDRWLREYSRLSAEYAVERRALAGPLEAARRDEYLRGELLSAHPLPGIGSGLKHKLSLCGIKSAYDVLHEGVAGVRGFGPARARQLLEWARSLARASRMNPELAIPEAEQRALVRGFQQRQLALRAQLEAEVAPLRARADGVKRRADELAARLEAGQRALAAIQATQPPPEGAIADALRPRPWEAWHYFGALMLVGALAGFGSLAAWLRVHHPLDAPQATITGDPRAPPPGAPSLPADLR